MADITSIKPSGIYNPANPDLNIVVLPNCNAPERCAFWLGPLIGQENIGCGIYVLKFMGEIDPENEKKGFMEAKLSGIGTPFNDIIDWFNKKLIASGKNEDASYYYNIIEFILDISNLENLSLFFELLYNHLPINTCTIVKLNRHPDTLIRKRMTGMDLTPGHYVLISKDKDGILRTYEPIYSKPGDCKSFPYKGFISSNFFKSYQKQGYISASLLIMQRTRKNIIEDHDIKMSDVNITKHEDDIDMSSQIGGNSNDIQQFFSMPEDTIDNLIEDIKNSTICIKDKKGGRKKKTKKNKSYRKKIYKNNKNKSYRKKKYKKSKTNKKSK